mmetsp:Transcript_18385/g.39918  ORF Transcript_18385/g.39918 Transcript_18385/m.39918 type:complete len:92 (-) Transcript_18385:22-297(-)
MRSSSLARLSLVSGNSFTDGQDTVPNEAMDETFQGLSSPLHEALLESANYSVSHGTFFWKSWNEGHGISQAKFLLQPLEIAVPPHDAHATE